MLISLKPKGALVHWLLINDLTNIKMPQLDDWTTSNAVFFIKCAN